MIRRVTFWALFPLAIPQALRLKKTAPRFAGASGNNFGLYGSGRRCRLLTVGDSLIAGVGARTYERALAGQTAKAICTRFNVAVEWSAFGKIGATTEQIERLILPKIPAQQFDVVLVSSGVNDVTGLKRSATYEKNLSALVEGLRAHSPNAQIVIAGLPPMNRFPLLPQPLRFLLGLRSHTFDQVVKKVATHNRAIHVPVDIEPDPDKFAKDGYHPSESGYADFGEAISACLDPVSTQSDSTYSGTNVATIR